jgi:hypothetical protein
MDPKACLLHALSLSQDTNTVQEALDALEDYRGWRRAGGFEPMIDGVPGDSFAADLRGDCQVQIEER